LWELGGSKQRNRRAAVAHKGQKQKMSSTGKGFMLSRVSVRRVKKIKIKVIICKVVDKVGELWLILVGITCNKA